MKVLSKPPKRKWTREVTCYECGAKLLVKPKDFKAGTFNAVYWAGDSGDRLPYIKCPRCKTYITFKWSKLPPVVTDQLRLLRR